MASELLGLTPYVIIKEEDLTFVARSHQLSKYQMSLCMRKPIIRVPTRSDTNQAVQSQKMVRGWKFWIYKVEELCCSCSENKADLRLCFCQCSLLVFRCSGSMLVFRCSGSNHITHLGECRCIIEDNRALE